MRDYFNNLVEQISIETSVVDMVGKTVRIVPFWRAA
jgi:hypothetical protein